MKQRTKHLTVRDGNLIPLGNNFAYVLGDHPNKVDDVDIGPNNRNGLSVNHGEIMQFGRTGVRVFSAEPILNGVSPSKLVQSGVNPNAVFAAQERYKNIHHLKDDGSHAKFGDWLKGLFGKKETVIDDTPEYYGGDIKPAVATAALPAKFNGSQAAAARYAEGYQFGKKIARKRDEVAPYLMPFIMGPLAPGAILGEGGGKAVDTSIQILTNNKRNGWADAATFFLDKNPKAKNIGQIVADFINPGYTLGSIATPAKISKLIDADWKPSIGSKYDKIPSSIRNTLNPDTKYNRLLKDRIARQVGNFPNQQRKIYNESLHYIGQAFDDVPENIQKDLLRDSDLLDNFITRVRWGEGKDMISSLKYEANKMAKFYRNNTAYQKRIKYKYKNVPSIFIYSSSVNDNPEYMSLVKEFGKSNVDKARYYLSKALREQGYTKINPNTDYNDFIGQVAYNIKNKKPIKISVPNYDRASKQPLDKVNDFVYKYGVQKQIDPANGIINKDLQEIARISPKYADSIYFEEMMGSTPEEIVNELLDRKWTFIRGINDFSGTLGLEDAKVAMSKIAENARGGRADIQVFPSRLPTEDIAYFSNSPTTAISYTYPTQPGNGYIGIYGRKEPFIEGANLVDKWIKNQLPTDNILEAPSTIPKIRPAMEIPENRLKSFELGLQKGISRGKIEGAGKADFRLHDLLQPSGKDTGYRHFLIKGTKGEELPYITLKDIREVPKVSPDSFSDKFDALLKEFNVKAEDLNRGHSNKPSSYFSLGKKLGGETKIKNDYLTIPLKGNPLYDISGETKYSDYVTKHGPDFSTIKTTNNRPYNQYNVETAYDYFKSKGLNNYQIAAFLANAIEESGIEPYALDKTGVYYGISQWDNSRYSVIRKSKKDKDYSIEDESKYLNNQLAYYYNSVMNGNTTSDWNHGGKGSGYNTAADARQAFRNATSVDDAIKALVLGYVRPTGGINSYKNRAKVAEQIYKLISKQ